MASVSGSRFFTLDVNVFKKLYEFGGYVLLYLQHLKKLNETISWQMKNRVKWAAVDFPSTRSVFPLPVSWPHSRPGGNKNVKKESEVEC